MNVRNFIVRSFLIASVSVCTFVCNARWYDQDRTETGRNLRMMPPESFTTTPQWQNDRYNNRAWYDIQRTPRGYSSLDEYSDNWCSGPECGQFRQW